MAAATELTAETTALLLPDLPDPTKYVRLLCPVPHNGNQLPLRFDIVTFHIDECPQYATLSYTWQNPFFEEHPSHTSDRLWSNPSATIYCNNAAVSILPNLHKALKQVVVAKYMQHLYVDALCINQDDIREKAAQISLLHKVFFNAEQCICWLGPQDRSIVPCITALKLFHGILTTV
jgi:hypothetical protein